MKEVTMYKADNGRLFETAENCKKYETEVSKKVDEILEAMQVFIGYCKTNEVCETCPFYEPNNNNASCYCKLKLNAPARWREEYIDIEKL